MSKKLNAKIKIVDDKLRQILIGGESVGTYGKRDLPVALQASVRALQNLGYEIEGYTDALVEVCEFCKKVKS